MATASLVAGPRPGWEAGKDGLQREAGSTCRPVFGQQSELWLVKEMIKLHNSNRGPEGRWSVCGSRDGRKPKGLRLNMLVCFVMGFIPCSCVHILSFDYTYSPYPPFPLPMAPSSFQLVSSLSALSHPQ